MAQLKSAGEADRARAEALAAQAVRLERELEAAAMECDAARATAARAAAEGPVRPNPDSERSRFCDLPLPAASTWLTNSDIHGRHCALVTVHCPSGQLCATLGLREHAGQCKQHAARRFARAAQQGGANNGERGCMLGRQSAEQAMPRGSCNFCRARGAQGWLRLHAWQSAGQAQPVSLFNVGRARRAW